MKVFDCCPSNITFIIDYIRWLGSLKFGPNDEVSFSSWDVLNTINNAL